MAKQRPILPEAQKKKIEINKILGHARDETQKPPIYANQVQITIGNEEIVLDFYRAGPGRGEVYKKIDVAYVQRVIMPPSAAARFAKVFSELVETNMRLAETEESTEPEEKP